MAKQPKVDVTEAGRQSFRLLQDPAFERAVETLRDRYVGAWKNERNPVERDRHWYLQAALEDVVTSLNAEVEQAALAATDAVRKERMRKAGL